MIAVTLPESDRQAVLLALALTALARPGWRHYLGEIADQLRGRDMFEAFQRFNEPDAGALAAVLDARTRPPRVD